MSKPTEDPLTPHQAAAVDALARAALVKAEALVAISQSGFTYPELLVPVISPQLRAISPGEGDPLRVVAVDERGGVRTGERGAMTARELVAQLKTHPSFSKGFKK